MVNGKMKIVHSNNKGIERVNHIKQGLKDSKRIKELEDMNLALTNENEELEAKVNKWISLQEKGYTAVSINNGLITHAVQVLPSSTFTYTQEIPTMIGTALYSKIPIYELVNGKICINTAQKIKHDSV